MGKIKQIMLDEMESQELNVQDYTLVYTVLNINDTFHSVFSFRSSAQECADRMNDIAEEEGDLPTYYVEETVLHNE